MQVTLSEKVSQTPPIRQRSGVSKPRTLRSHPCMSRDDSWRSMKITGQIVSRKALSNFITYSTNGVLVLGETLDGQEQLVHLENLDLETIKSPSTHKISKPKKPSKLELALELL